MVKIHQYFETWYVPNNMAVVLAGDIDYDRTIAMVDKHFGAWKRGEVPAFTFTPETAHHGTGHRRGVRSGAEWVDIAWRFEGVTSDHGIDAAAHRRMMSNGKAGLIDLDLIQAQKVLDAYAYASTRRTTASSGCTARPRRGRPWSRYATCCWHSWRN